MPATRTYNLRTTPSPDARVQRGRDRANRAYSLHKRDVATGSRLHRLEAAQADVAALEAIGLLPPSSSPVDDLVRQAAAEATRTLSLTWLKKLELGR